MGSMSTPATPNDNAVAERTIRTIKHQLLECPVSCQVENLTQMREIFCKRIEFYNKNFRPKRACGETPKNPDKRRAFHFAPERVLARATNDANHQKIIEFKYKAIQENPLQ